MAWNLDPGHSRVAFTARHLGFAKVSGDFKKFTAVVARGKAMFLIDAPLEKIKGAWTRFGGALQVDPAALDGAKQRDHEPLHRKM